MADSIVGAELKGVQEAINAFTGAVQQLEQSLGQGLFQEAEVVMTDSKANYVPVKVGTLRSSGFVDEPVWTGSTVIVQLGFGGPAETYALIQHENLGFHHTVGQAKYLETPMLEAAAGIDARLVSHIRQLSGLR